MNRYLLGIGVVVAIALILAFISRHFGFVSGSISSLDIMSYLGSVVTVLSFAAGCYFALLAVSAFGHIREIEKFSTEAKTARDQLQDELAKAKSANERASTMNSLFLQYLVDSSNALADSVSDLGDGKASPEGFVNRVIRFRERCLFGLSTEGSDRVRHARNLVEMGTREDLIVVRDFLGSSKDPDAAGLLRVVREKLATRAV